jgi:glutaredoxin
MARLKINRTNTAETDESRTRIVASNIIVGKKSTIVPQIIDDNTNIGVSMDELEAAPPPPPVGVANPTP